MSESSPFEIARPVTMSAMMTMTIMMNRIMRLILKWGLLQTAKFSAAPRAREGILFRWPPRWYLVNMGLSSQCSAWLAFFILSSVAPNGHAGATKVTVAAPDYASLPASLAAMSYPYNPVPRLVLVRRTGGASIATAALPAPAAALDGVSLLQLIQCQITFSQPEVSWGWGGTYRLHGREWSAWEFTAPSMGGLVSCVIAATSLGSSIFAISLSAPTGEFSSSSVEFGEILSSVAVVPAASGVSHHLAAPAANRPGSPPVNSQ